LEKFKEFLILQIYKNFDRQIIKYKYFDKRSITDKKSNGAFLLLKRGLNWFNSGGAIK